MNADQTPEPITFRTVPPKIAPVASGWQAWWEDYDMWDGFVLYTDLPTAKAHAAVDYVGEEYGWVPGDDPDGEAPETTLTWVFEHARWHLLDNGKSTLVQLYETVTYAPAVVSAAAPPTGTDRRAQMLDALDFAYCQGLGFDTPEALLAAYDASRGVPVPPPADQTAEGRPTLTPDPDRDGVILHLPEITYLDTQVWAVDVGLSHEALRDLRTVLPEPTDQIAALLRAANIAESLRQFEPATGARKAAQVSENVGILRVAAVLRRVAAEEQPTKPDQCPHGCDTSICPCLACEADEGRADEQPAETQPRRGDTFETWLKAQRDAAADHPQAYQAADGLLDLYRLHADTGTPLGEHVCEARTVGDCDCLEQPETQEALPPLVDELRRALAEASGFNFDGLEAHDYQAHAAAVRRVVARYIRADVELATDGPDDDCCRNYGRALARWLEADARNAEPQP